MFIRRIKRANGQISIVLVEGYRENGKVKQRTIEYLGTESELTADDRRPSISSFSNIRISKTRRMHLSS